MGLGLSRLSGEVLAGNQTMLQMCEELGFTIEADSSDSALRTVRLALAKGEPRGQAAEREAAS
jgi:acetyltransferase